LASLSVGSIIIVPGTLAQFSNVGVLRDLSQAFQPGTWVYYVTYMALIIFFTFFYTAIGTFGLGTLSYLVGAALLAGTAASLGLIHTVLGPDHYVPFIAMSRARNWSNRKTALVAALSGLGHVGGSILIGLAGLALGLAVGQLTPVEQARGNLAAWGLLAFGVIYMIWGIKKAYDGRPHIHSHVHADGTRHDHGHGHLENEHAHPHGRPANITPWILFTIFVFGPCEPLIPVLMYPAARSSLPGLIMVTAAFSVATIATMVTLTLLGLRSLHLAGLGRLERHAHALAGGALALCGFGMVFLGL